MISSVRLQLLVCLVVYATSAHAIMVKFGTRDGPIEPPTPEPVQPAIRPYRSPAPVWEDRSDTPDPNAQWRPRLFVPQPRYTHVIISIPSPESTAQPISNAQHFVNQYLPTNKQAKEEIVNNLFSPTQILSSQRLPGIGLRYFAPVYVNNDNGPKKTNAVKEDAKYNDIETNEVHDTERRNDNDQQWQAEKSTIKRHIDYSQNNPVPFVYQWPTYVPRYQ